MALGEHFEKVSKNIEICSNISYSYSIFNIIVFKKIKIYKKRYSFHLHLYEKKIGLFLTTSFFHISDHYPFLRKKGRTVI